MTLLAPPGRPVRAGLQLARLWSWAWPGGRSLVHRIIAANLAGFVVFLTAMMVLREPDAMPVPARDPAQFAVAAISRALEPGTAADAVAGRLAGLEMPEGWRLFLVDAQGGLMPATQQAAPAASRPGAEGIGEGRGGLSRLPALAEANGTGGPRAAFVPAAGDNDVSAVFVAVLAPEAGGEPSGARDDDERLRIAAVGILTMLGISLVLASTIATPLAGLAAAAEAAGTARRTARIRIPDFGGRQDEIGRLAGALRAMVGALYERIEANERLAADVAHELKNPLASIRSAVSTMRVMTRADQRERLLAIIEHDVRRLDRLVSDIAAVSRLDSELLHEEEEEFDLTAMLSRLCEHFAREVESRGVAFHADLPDGPVALRGIEARLAQVLANLFANALSFSEPGDAIRLWCRRRGERVLIVIEDTGPGIPPGALERVFDRFYSERPEGAFGEHSGLGLAISRQIVETHGGVIWAENVSPTPQDPRSDPCGARFVVGLRA